jgi:serine/threonine protein phosphatase PrpC
MQFLEISGVGNRAENLDYHTSYISEKTKYFMVVDGYRTERDFLVKYSNKIMLEKINKKGNSLLKILKKFVPENVNMSFVFLEIEGKNVKISHAGDCRVYIDGELETDDQSVAWSKLNKRGKSKEEISTLVCDHPQRNILTNSIKKRNKTEDINLKEINITLSESEVLLCTDGFWSKNHLNIKNKKLYLNEEIKYSDNYTAIIINL